MSKGRITLDDDADGLAASEDYGDRAIVSDGTRSALRLAANTFYAAVAVAAVVGAVLLIRRSDPTRRGLFLVVVGVVQMLSPLATFGDPRFKMPMYPTMAVCAAVALVGAAEGLRGRRGSARAGEDRSVPAGAATG